MDKILSSLLNTSITANVYTAIFKLFELRGYKLSQKMYHMKF